MNDDTPNGDLHRVTEAQSDFESDLIQLMSDRKNCWLRLAVKLVDGRIKVIQVERNREY